MFSGTDYSLQLRERTYLFIDGGYLREQYTKALQEWFVGEGEVDFSRLIQSFNAGRTFYYDCLDKEQRSGEIEADYNARLAQQYAYYDRIREAPGCHIRLGVLTGKQKGGKKERRQKEVDILLAVDMLTHAARQNMTQAILLSGDRDFRPAVESLVQLGVYVTVAADPQHVTRELTWAASAYHRLGFFTYYDWSQQKLQDKYSTPRQGVHPLKFSKGYLLSEGLFNGDPVQLYDIESQFYIYFPSFQGEGIRYFAHSDVDRLKLYFKIHFGEIIWDVEKE